MAAPVLLIVVGTRVELLASISLLRMLQAVPPELLPFQPRLVISGQERTEIDQTLDAFGIEPDFDLGIKAPNLADSGLSARLLDEMESTIRNKNGAAVLVVGSSATAWATAIAAYFKHIPVIHYQAGVFSLADERPFPEWLHRQEITRLAQLHLCVDNEGAQLMAAKADAEYALLEGAKTQYSVVGDGGDEALAYALANPPSQDEDPTLVTLRPGAPRVLIFMRRREHHANGLKPLCQALDTLSLDFPDHEFIIVFSLQSFICDAFIAMLPGERPNLHSISPLPYPVFVREMARSHLIITDSMAVSREAALLHRPTVVVGAYSIAASLPAVASQDFVVTEMQKESLVSAITHALNQPPPPPSPETLSVAPTGQLATETIVEWWNKRA